MLRIQLAASGSCSVLPGNSRACCTAVLHNVFPCRKIVSLVNALAEMIGGTGKCYGLCPWLAFDLSMKSTDRTVNYI